MTLRIRMFGGLSLEGSGRVLPRIPSRGARSLFAYLVLNRGRDLSRDLVAGTFWPDMPDSQARRRLSQSLWQIQTHLSASSDSGPWLSTTTGAVGFIGDSDHWLDVEEFDRISSDLKVASSAQLRDAVELYRGDLLAGEYDDWVLAEAQPRRDAFLDVLAKLSQQLKSAGSFDEALEYARRLASHEPLREESHREVMRLSYLAGRPNEGLLQYEICYSILADELGTEPQPATTQLFESIAESRSLPVPVRQHHATPMIGRGEERSQAVAMLESALNGAGGLLLVEGSVGIGKSRLLDTISDDATWRGMTVLGAAGETDLHQALDRGISPLQAEQLSSVIEPAWLKRLAARVPSLRPVAVELPEPDPLRPAEELQGALEAVAQTVIALSRMTPVVLILDDLDNATAETVSSFRYLAGRIETESVALVATMTDPRRTGLWETVREMDGLRHARRLTLAPLSHGETDELLRATSPTARSEMANRLHDETGGNPLFLVETIRSRQEQEVADADSNRPRRGYEIPDTIEAAIRRRLEVLGDLDRAALEAMAVLNTPSSVDWVSEVAGIGRAEAAHHLDELCSRGLLLRDDRGYAFVHEQVRDLVYGETTNRPALHRAAADVLDGLIEPAALAFHLAEAGAASEAAMAFLEAADQSADVAAFASAVDEYRMALELDAAMGSSARYRALAGLEAALDVLGRRDEQEDVISAMLDTEPDDVDALVRLAWLRASTDAFAAARQVASRALETGSADASQQAECHRVLGMVGLWSGATQEAVTHLRHSAELAVGPQRATAAEALGRALSAAGRHEEASEQTERALGLFAAAEDRRGQAEALGSLGIIAMERGHLADSIQFYERAISVCRAIGYLYGEGVNLVNLANSQWTSGRLADALTSFSAALEVFGALNHRRGVAVTSANAAAVHLTIGDLSTATRLCETAQEYFEAMENRDGLAQVLTTRAEINYEQDDLPNARTAVEAALLHIHHTGNRWLEVQARRTQAFIEVASGNHQSALDVVDDALKLTGDFPDFVPALLSARALAHLGAGDIDSALAQSAQAMEGLPPISTDALAVTVRHSELLAAAGDPSSSAYLAQAQQLMESLFEGLEPEHSSRARSRFAQLAEAPEESILLVREGVPTGRPLTESDYTEISWTPLIQDEAAILDPSERRRAQILRLVRDARSQEAAPRVEDLAAVLNISVRTARREIAVLRKSGHTVATRGARFTGS